MKYPCFITTLAVLTLIISSCSKSKAPYVPDTSLNTVSATISIGNNAAFQFSVTGASAKVYPQFGYPTTYQIDAKDANNHRLSIVVEEVTKTGTYNFTTNNGVGNGLSFIKDEGLLSQVTYWTSDPSIASKGSVTVTVLNNHHIEGSFTAFCKNDHDTGDAAQVSNGSFKGNF